MGYIGKNSQTCLFKCKTFQYSIRKILSEPPLQTQNGPLIKIAEDVAKERLTAARGTGRRVGGKFWTDAALFGHMKGIESFVLGPKGHGIHTEEEWVDVESLQTLVGVYSEIILRFCA